MPVSWELHVSLALLPWFYCAVHAQSLSRCVLDSLVFIPLSPFLHSYINVVGFTVMLSTGVTTAGNSGQGLA
jgi:accessory gene regulator protein AgrB